MCFFFVKQKTAYEMRISDWSSDVCSSDLFEEMKIDRRFVGPAAHDPAARAIVSSSIGLARKLGMTTVAEGIETRAAWDCAAGLGCDVAQGYFIAEPLPPADLGARSEEHTSELQSLMRISYAVFCLKQKKIHYV